jgi:hypothetical protein
MVLALILVSVLSCALGSLFFGRVSELSSAAQERQRLEAQEWKERAEAERPTQLFWAWSKRALMTLTFLAALIVVSLFGMRYALTIAPNRQGIFPLLLGRAKGSWAVFDPNRSPTAVTLIGDNVPKVTHALPAGTESAQAQITSQAQMVQLTAAAVSGEGETEKKARELVSGLGGRTGLLTKPLPPVHRSALEPSHVERLLIEAGEIEEADYE